MSDQQILERRYRRLLACYPRSFRRENEEEILGVLLSTAADGQRRVGLTEAADLIRGAVRARLRLRAGCPPTARAAIRLMCAGAVLELGYLVTVIVTEGSVRSAVLARYPGLTAAQWHLIVVAHLLPDEIFAPVGIGLWLWLAWAHGQGRYWARVVFSVYFGLFTFGLLMALAEQAAIYATADLAASVALWMVQAAVVVLIFNSRSAPFYQPKPRPRALRAEGIRS